MIVLSANMDRDSAENRHWNLVDKTIRKHLPSEIMQTLWRENGYEGLFPIVPEYFGMSKMYRNEKSYVTYEFTEQQWTVFLLRWS